MSEEEALLRKSERTFAAADLLLEANNLESAASRAYYAWFYVAEALLLSLGVRSSRHGQVIAQYGLHFAKEGLLDRRFHRTLDEAFEIRQYADYTSDPDLDPVKIGALLREGRAFLDAARSYLQGKGNEDDSPGNEQN